MPYRGRSAEGYGQWSADGPAEHPPGWGPPAWVRLWLPVVVSFVVQVPAALAAWRFGRGFPGAPGGELAVGLIIAHIGPLALIGARRAPGPVVAIVAAAASADLLVSTGRGGPPYIALAFAIIGAIARGARSWAWISVSAAWVVTLLLGATLGLNWHPWQIAGPTLGILIAMGLGEGIRTRQERFADIARRTAQRRQSEVQAERVRIARELHDVLAHSLSQINVQAGVGLHLMDKQPQKAADALAAIKETSKRALDEVRSVLGVLRAEDGADVGAPLMPEPDLSRLPELAASAGAQGVVVSIDNALRRPPPAATQLAIYRIVQESLTNVVRHANASRVTVGIEFSDGGYRVAIEDDGSGSNASGGSPGGRGILGMRERAELLGGTLHAGTTDRGGFRVTATIPAEEGA